MRRLRVSSRLASGDPLDVFATVAGTECLEHGFRLLVFREGFAKVCGHDGLRFRIHFWHWIDSLIRR